MRLQTKIILLLTPCILLPMLTLGWVAYSVLNAIDAAHWMAEQQAVIQVSDSAMVSSGTVSSANRKG